MLQSLGDVHLQPVRPVLVDVDGTLVDDESAVAEGVQRWLMAQACPGQIAAARQL
ncbi:MAG TPA: hypothetical protein VIJ15_10660 [Dermatophilaceae bacterium]